MPDWIGYASQTSLVTVEPAVARTTYDSGPMNGPLSTARLRRYSASDGMLGHDLAVASFDIQRHLFTGQVDVVDELHNAPVHERPLHGEGLFAQVLPVGVLELEHAVGRRIQRVVHMDAAADLFDVGALLGIQRPPNHLADGLGPHHQVDCKVGRIRRDAWIGKHAQLNTFHVIGTCSRGSNPAVMSRISWRRAAVVAGFWNSVAYSSSVLSRSATCASTTACAPAGKSAGVSPAS